jgi:DNA-binding MarR family transcriptional regulator
MPHKNSSAGPRRPLVAPPHAPVMDLEQYAPAYFTWIANKLSRGASQAYLSCFGVGIETWRVLVLLAIEGGISAQQACASIGMDKSSMSRCFKEMQAQGFITLVPDPSDGRARIARITPQGRKMHDRIRELALVREQAFMAVLSPRERTMLLRLLHRLHENLPVVEAATQDHLARRQAAAARRRRAAAAPAAKPLPGASE